MSESVTDPGTPPDPGTPTAAEPAPLRHRVSGALKWSFINSVFTRVAQLGLSIVLARLIAPRDFGIFAVALVVINITLSVAELGASVALVRHEGDPAEIAPTVATIAIASSTALAGLTLGFAPLIASSLGSPEATGVVRLLAVALLTSGFAAVPGAILQREFRQDHKLVADTASFVLSTVVVIVLAVAGLGAWALAWSRIVANTTSAVVMTQLSRQPFRLGFDRERAREILGFSLPLAGASLLVFAVLNVDYIVIGAMLGPVELGFYLIAFNLSSWPVNAFSTTIRTVSVAGFAQLRSDTDELRRGFASSMRLLMTIAVPACVVLGALAGPLVRFVYGNRWEPSAAPLAALALLGAVRIALELAYDFLAAVARTRAILAIHAIWLVALVPALAIGADVSGIAGVALGHAIVVGAIITPAYLFVLARTGVTVGSFAGGLVRPVIGAAAMLAVGWAVTAMSLSDFWTLATGASLAGIAYCVVVVPGSGLTDLIRRRFFDRT